MGQKYTQLGVEERCEIARRRQAGESVRQIAASLDRAPSSIARELKRNDSSQGYMPIYAQQQARARHWTGSKLLRDPALQADVLSRLAADTLTALLAPLPARLRRTLTFDNGTEFAHHYMLHKPLNMKTFFCDPHAPWQKGGVENAIGRLRRDLPRKTDLDTLSPDDLLQIARRYNHVPRKCLDYQTPAEVFAKLLHFKCESTFPLSRE